MTRLFSHIGWTTAILFTVACSDSDPYQHAKEACGDSSSFAFTVNEYLYVQDSPLSKISSKYSRPAVSKVEETYYADVLYTVLDRLEYSHCLDTPECDPSRLNLGERTLHSWSSDRLPAIEKLVKEIRNGYKALIPDRDPKLSHFSSEFPYTLVHVGGKSLEPKFCVVTREGSVVWDGYRYGPDFSYLNDSTRRARMNREREAAAQASRIQAEEQSARLAQLTRQNCTEQTIKDTIRDGSIRRREKRQILNSACIGTFVSVTGEITAIRSDSGTRLSLLVDEVGTAWEFPANNQQSPQTFYSGVFLWAARNDTYFLGDADDAEMIKQGCSNDSQGSANSKRLCRVMTLESSQGALSEYSQQTKPQSRERKLTGEEIAEKLRRDTCSNISAQWRSGLAKEATKSAEVAMAWGVRCNPDEL